MNRIPNVLLIVVSACFLHSATSNCLASASPFTAQEANVQEEEATTPTENADAQDSKTGLVASGVVFIDNDADGKLGPNDNYFSGVKVSNGKEIVKTNERGQYELPLEEDSVIFVIKPTGFRSSLSDNNLPEFYYVHKPNGSPQLKYPGSKPTGNLPKSIDFPLYQQSEPENFKIILFGDPQPRNKQEVDYITHDVVSELIGNNMGSSFGVSLGDLAFDNLETLDPMNQSIAMIGIPWYNIIGNHDLNLDATERKHINETFEDIYGPTYYSFDYGQVHFVVMDNIDWAAPTETKDRYHYFPNFGERQLEFLKNDLALIPETQMVVLLMHCPITSVKDKGQMFELIQDRPFCVSIAGHQHYHQHLFLGEEQGFKGKEKHHHIINVTVSGSWWGGVKNDRGIPHSTMGDGAPNGYSTMTFTRDTYQMDFKAAGRPADEQMRIHLPNVVEKSKIVETEVWVNVYNGSSRSTVEMAIDDDSEWTKLEQKIVPDPYYKALVESEKLISPPVEPKLASPKVSHHLWMTNLGSALEPGTHLLRVKTTDMHGRSFFGHRSFRVTGDPVSKPTTASETKSP